MKTAAQFEPETQIGNAIVDLEKTLREAGGVIDRLGRLKDTLVAEVDKLRAEREVLEVYTEEEAAILLKVDTKNADRARKHLAELRRTLNLPHMSVGNKPRYTKRHLEAICSMLEIDPKGKSANRKAA